MADSDFCIVKGVEMSDYIVSLNARQDVVLQYFTELVNAKRLEQGLEAKTESEVLKDVLVSDLQNRENEFLGVSQGFVEALRSLPNATLEGILATMPANGYKNFLQLRLQQGI
jgi:hypothetical protein